MFRSERSNRKLNRILQVAVLVYQGIALLAFVGIPFLAIRWLQTPFLGAFVEQTMVFNGVGQGEPAEAWGLYLDRSLWLNHQLVQVDGAPVRTEAQIRAALADRAPGDQVVIVTRQLSDGAEQARTITLQTFPDQARLLYFIVPYFVGLVFLASGLWIFGIRRSEPVGRAYALFATSVALASGALFDLYTTHWLTVLWTLSLPMAAGAVIDLALVFPQEIAAVQKRPYLRLTSYVIGLLLVLPALFHLYDFNHPAAYIIYWRYIYIFSGLAVFVFAAMLLYRRFSSRSPIIRQQANAILFGMVASFGPLAVWLLLTSLPSEWLPFLQLYNFPPVLLLIAVILPLVMGFTIMRYRLLRTDFMLRQGLLYSLLSVLVLGGYALIVSGLSLVFGQAFRLVDNPLFLGLLVFALALGLIPMRNRLQQFVDSVFFRGQQAYEQRVRKFGRELTNRVDLKDIIKILRENINTSLLPDSLHVFIYDPLNEQYAAAPGDDDRPTSDLRFTPTSPLVQALGKTRLPIVYDESTLSSDLKSEQGRLSLLGALIFVPLPGADRPIGWLALGPRRSGAAYTRQDLNFFELICDQASVAIERAQVIFNLERRVREMNILARVAQGVNITVVFDDILELVYAQTGQVMPVDNFHITLYNKESNYYFFAFCLEGNDRLTAKENHPLPPNIGLSPEVIRTRRSILTSEYQQECSAHSTAPFAQDVHAWVGVPLNAGAETIGALSVCSRDPSVVYTLGQQELLQSIAEQTAGAIVKSRLFQETERRAHQLATLNEITRQLTGTLETEPLVQSILNDAVSILNCEAGSLFLVDEATDELIFKATAGPVAQNLAGQRLPPGTGIVGEAVMSRKPVLANNVLQTASWSASTDQNTGFVTRSILAVPLQVKEHVIGVLEVINRKDGLPFVADDQNLLAAFASQAAVAIENARLYTLTDQELNDRVEELSVLQRIDRELNASLDVTRAMRLTLDWALRQSKAEVGLIGILGDKGIRLTAQQGYDEMEQTYKNSPIPLIQPALRQAVESGQPQRVSLDDRNPGFLSGAQSQMVVPIRREAQVIGLIVLESRTPDSHPAAALTFLTRLSDHAAIAIANAQLYAEVQAANEAKSEFVSFVAHELKNPMTSIKGYSELLSKGAVGPITDMQANFLSTILSNVERMSTLVSDLNDNSKIEAGKLRLDFKAVELAEAVDEIVRSTKRQMDDKKQSASLKIPAKLPKIWADRTRLAQIITNLVSNANKYTPESGLVTIGAEKSANQWDPDGVAEVVHIWVQDTGIGISLEDQKNIFQKFFRSEDSKAREAPGTGLGLNITKSLVEMMGGRIWFDSEYRQGTTFHFTVPVAQE
jgi:signal transduction histidine kinase